jgi:hypothetical protein
MILVDQPYVSELLRQTIVDHKLPVVLTPAARELDFAQAPGAVSEQTAITTLVNNPSTRVLTNSENAIGWVAQNLGFTSLPGSIDLFKNKLKFRQLLAPLFPDFRFREVAPEETLQLDPQQIGHPFVLKPAVGFFSLGVHMVTQPEDWPRVQEKLAIQLATPSELYPREVLDTSSFILEEIITGTEYAIDAYFDGEGHPIITNIFEHLFSSATDVSDRVYLTGEETIRNNLDRFTAFLAEVGKLAGLKNFPVHVELRVDAAGRMVPIEINPLRFGGWCTTADLTALAFGFNPYVAFLKDLRPDWEAIFSTRKGKAYSIVVLDNSTGLAGNSIQSFAIEDLARRFKKTLSIRPVDHTQHPLFGFLFTETPAEDRGELDWVLHADLREFAVTVDGC